VTSKAPWRTRYEDPRGVWNEGDDHYSTAEAEVALRQYLAAGARTVYAFKWHNGEGWYSELFRHPDEVNLTNGKPVRG